MTKHTPGPWRASISEYTTEVVTDNSKSKAVVNWMGFDDSDVPKAEHEANAALIARAPELLEENAKLRELIAEIRQFCCDSQLVGLVPIIRKIDEVVTP